MTTTTLKLLNKQQTEYFDTEYVNDNLFLQLKPYLSLYKNKPEFKILDIGGGNGCYADKLLRFYNNAEVTLIEPDRYLLSKNKYNPRKKIIVNTFQAHNFKKNSYDVIHLNWVLHHFISDSYENTQKLQKTALMKAHQLLKPGGSLIILENHYDGFLFDDLPSQIIYQLTSASFIAPLIKQAGANTAGVGVCFHSENAWLSMLNNAGFSSPHSEHCYDFSELSFTKRLLLAINKQRVGLIVAVKKQI